MVLATLHMRITWRKQGWRRRAHGSLASWCLTPSRFSLSTSLFLSKDESCWYLWNLCSLPQGFHCILGPRDVRVRMKAVGICGSDVHYLKLFLKLQERYISKKLHVK